MRPGSPVKPLRLPPMESFQGFRFLGDPPQPNWERTVNQIFAERIVEKPPASVWVALATFTRAVRVNDAPVTGPITGGPQAIFARAGHVEEVNAAEVVAVCLTEAEALNAAARHKALNPNLAAEYRVSEQPLGSVEAEPAPAAPETHLCIGGCGAQLSGGVSICQPCRERQWAQSGWKPSGTGEE